MTKINFSLRFLLVLVMTLVANATVFANDVVYDFSNSMPSAWTSNVSPYGYETTGSCRGMQFTQDATLTLKGATDVTKVVITCSCNIADQNTISVSVGGNDWGTVTMAKESNVEKTFASTTASGDLVINITRKSKSVYIKQIVVSGNVEGGGTEGGDTGETSTLDPDYTYAEPTVVGLSGATCSNTAYSFINNNIQVSATTGAQTTSYFGCNAGNKITFTATQPMKAIVINGYVKQDFSASVDNGDIAYVDASDDAVEADPVVLITDIDSKSVTISCDKQLRCYEVEIYFNENPDVEIDNPSGGEGDYTYEYEPTTPTNLDITFDEAEYADYSSYVGYSYTDIYFTSDDYEMELAVFAPAVDGTVIEEGVYEINDTYNDGTVQASPGGDDYYDYPAYIITGFEYDESTGYTYYDTAYYIVSGTLTVVAAPEGVKMTLEGKTYYGSTVKATFTGEAVNVGDTDGIETINTTSSSDNNKQLQNGHVIIRKAGKTYDVNGIRMK